MAFADGETSASDERMNASKGRADASDGEARVSNEDAHTPNEEAGASDEEAGALVRKLTFTADDARGDADALVGREWLLTNGLGGFASGSVAGVPTRRYHALLVAALPAPLGRAVVFNHLAESARTADGRRALFGGQERADGSLELPGAAFLREFRLEDGLPVWAFELGCGTIIERRVVMPRAQNTTFVNYRLVAGGAARLTLRPYLHFRPLESPVNGGPAGPYRVAAGENFAGGGTVAGADSLEVSAAHTFPPLRFQVHGGRAAFTPDADELRNVFYRVEARRGYEHTGGLWSPGHFEIELTRETDATLVGSTETWEAVRAVAPAEAFAAERARRRGLVAAAHPAARRGLAAELVLAADQFVITPPSRRQDPAAGRAAGAEARSVIAGYHWFTDWGRDTMISLEGLTLSTGRRDEAGWILRTFAHYTRDGLIPNMFPDGSSDGLYHTADATLWFFHALDRHVETTGDRDTLAAVLPVLLDIVERHLAGTRFGIKVDEGDGLLRQGEEGYQLTWMDAKCDGWVVTPRRGKAVEINALWYNALRLAETWARELRGEAAARPLAAHADRARESFNERFWNSATGHLFDVVDGEGGRSDPACRPNQLLSISLRHAALAESRWESVLNAAREKLLTPVGLRSLAPGHPDYKPTYHGDLRTRDAAYHQGTVWAWLIGPFVDAWLKVYPRDLAGARRLLAGFGAHLDEACVGSISEVFDAEPPYAARGCVAQAWSVAEVLRCLVKTEETVNDERGTMK